MIICAQCGYENQLGHIFCTRCRARLDFNQVANQDLLKTREPGGRRWVRIMLILDLLMVVAIALSLWPSTVDARRGTAVDLQQARKKIVLMEKGVSVAPQVFSEQEINAYLAAAVEAWRASGRAEAESLKIQSVQVKVKPNAVVFAVAAVWGPGRMAGVMLGPLDITYDITAVPEVRNTGLRFAITQGHVGHLPLPGPLGYLVAPCRKGLFADLRQEYPFFGIINRFELEEGKVTVSLKR